MSVTPDPHPVETPVAHPPEFVGHPDLDAFVARHGGCEGIRSTMAEMSPANRTMLVSKMASIAGVSPESVLDALGLLQNDLKLADPPAWHQAPSADALAPAPTQSPTSDPVDHKVEEAEDREDLAEAMGADPHSEKTRGLLERIADRLLGRRQCG